MEPLVEKTQLRQSFNLTLATCINFPSGIPDKFDIVLAWWLMGLSQCVLRSLIIISKGSADVEKVLFDGVLLEAQPFKIGRLCPGRLLLIAITSSVWNVSGPVQRCDDRRCLFYWVLDIQTGLCDCNQSAVPGSFLVNDLVQVQLRHATDRKQVKRLITQGTWRCGSHRDSLKASLTSWELHCFGCWNNTSLTYGVALLCIVAWLKLTTLCLFVFHSVANPVSLSHACDFLTSWNHVLGPALARKLLDVMHCYPGISTYLTDGLWGVDRFRMKTD